jgi:hypothetical protein
MIKTFLSAASASCLALAMASAQSPYTQQEGDYLSLTGTVNSVDDDSFMIDYGSDMIEVEFDDAGLFDDPAESLYPGDSVTVYGTIDDDFFEGRVIEADTVYVRGDSTVYGSDANFSPSLYVDPYPTTVATSTFVSLDGEVDRIRNREIQLNVGGTMVSVDTMGLGYNPLDDEGRQRIEEGDRVTVIGEIDDTLFDETELSATAIYVTSSANSQQMSNRDRNERDMDDRDRGDRQNDRRMSDRMDRNRNDRNERYSSRGMSDMFNTSEFAMLDLNGNGYVTEREYVRATSDMDNITRSEARELFDAIAQGDNRLTRREFLNPDRDTEELFEEALMDDDS